jgi:integrase
VTCPTSFPSCSQRAFDWAKQPRCNWSNVDIKTGLIEVTGTVVRVNGNGLVISRTKTTTSQRVLEVPAWTLAMLKQRRLRLDNGPVFPAPLGGLRDPSNTAKDLRDAFVVAGFGWVTSHTLRKTVASLMDSAGLSARAAADQLGHSKVSMTTDIYFGRRVAGTGAADVLEALA